MIFLLSIYQNTVFANSAFLTEKNMKKSMFINDMNEDICSNSSEVEERVKITQPPTLIKDPELQSLEDEDDQDDHFKKQIEPPKKKQPQPIIKEFVDDVKNIRSYTDINILLAIQILLPSADSKDFVDRPTKKPLEKVFAEFKTIEKTLGVVSLAKEMLQFLSEVKQKSVDENNSSEESEKLVRDAKEQNKLIVRKLRQVREREKTKLEILNDFVESNYHHVGYDITEHDPEDYTSSPKFIKKLKSKDLRGLSFALHKMWKVLSRISVPMTDGGVSTLLHLPKPFMIPGGRFREFYYWDTYWIMEGLLVSDMSKSVENIILNFIDIINTYGYIPNGTRKYYLFRSQPPFFTMMLLKLLDIENGKYNDLIFGKGLEAAMKEYDFWDKNKKIVIIDKNGKRHELNYHYVKTNFPRPESFGEDVITNEKQSEVDDATMYTNLKSGAESGWDFSSRWLKTYNKISTIRAADQIPVDLNAILYRTEMILYTLLTRIGHKTKAAEFLKRSERRQEAINKVLYNPIEGCWMDYLYKENKFVDTRFYFSNIMPMIYGIMPPHEGRSEYDILKKYALEIFGYVGGIPASGTGKPTSQQWDFPNVWAPHQHMMVEFLLTIKENTMAFHVAKAFFNSVMAGYQKSKAFFEKYDCEKLGVTGAGGEYAPQTGFGWTNGTILSFILKFGDKLMDDYDFEDMLAEILKMLERRTRNPPSRNTPEEAKPLELPEEKFEVFAS